MGKIERGEELTAQVNEAIEDLQDQLSRGHTAEYLKLLEFYSSFRQYSFGNVMLILSQLETASLCAGYKAWEKKGHQVKPGSKALWIRGPMLKKLPDPDTGEIKEKLIGWLGLPVFDVSQLEGNVELLQPRHALEGDYQSLYEHSWQSTIKAGIKLREERMFNGIKGTSAKGEIVIHSDQSVAEKCLVLWHELSHQLLQHHELREETSRTQRELIAESTSFVVARCFGLDNPFSRDYVIGWKGTVERLHDNLTEIHKAVKRIMDMLWLEEVQLDNNIAA